MDDKCMHGLHVRSLVHECYNNRFCFARVPLQNRLNFA